MLNPETCLRAGRPQTRPRMNRRPLEAHRVVNSAWWAFFMGRGSEAEVRQQISEDAVKEIRHHVLNGLVVIESILKQQEMGMLTFRECATKIRHRLEEMERAVKGVRSHD